MRCGILAAGRRHDAGNDQLHWRFNVGRGHSRDRAASIRPLAGTISRSTLATAGTPEPMRPVTTLLALTFAAGFGGFVATACQAALDSPAQAEPLAATTAPAISALPT